MESDRFVINSSMHALWKHYTNDIIKILCLLTKVFLGSFHRRRNRSSNLMGYKSETVLQTNIEKIIGNREYRKTVETHYNTKQLMNTTLPLIRSYIVMLSRSELISYYLLKRNQELFPAWSIFIANEVFQYFHRSRVLNLRGNASSTIRNLSKY